MKHIKADLSKIEIVDCLYHRTYMTHPNPTLLVTVDGERKEYSIRWRAAKKDRLYHQSGLRCKLVVYDGFVLAYEIFKGDEFGVIANIKTMIERHEGQTWYFDTEKFYQLNAVPSYDFITVQQINTIDPIHLTYQSSIAEIVNDAFVICHQGKIVVQSSPIASDLDKKVKRFSLLDRDQASMYLSLSALLKICDSVSKLYGSDEIEKFDIPQYMIRHKTVNLSNLPVNVKDLSTTYVKPVEIIAYLMGLLNKESNENNCMRLLKLLRMICRNGIINAEDVDAENVYTDIKIELKPIVIE